MHRSSVKLICTHSNVFFSLQDSVDKCLDLLDSVPVCNVSNSSMPIPNSTTNSKDESKLWRAAHDRDVETVKQLVHDQPNMVQDSNNLGESLGM